jgi:hypothetical protein
MIAVALIAALLNPAPIFAAPKGKKEAAKLARRAKKHYQKSEFLEAAQLFLKSYELSNVPSQLRNAAKSFEKADALEQALAQWERYRSLRISRDERLEAEAHIDLIHEKQRKVQVQEAVEAARVAAENARLEAEAAKNAAVEARNAPPPPPPPPSPEVVIRSTKPAEKGTPIFPWLVIGAGAVLGIVSAVLWAVAQNNLDTLNKRLMIRDGNDLATELTYEEGLAEVDSINKNRNASGALLGTSIAAIVAGGIWLTLEYALD